ncbi:MAG: hypothetical protein JEZ03_03030 [Bacteroidales bacterium]|nr:hypothetical protein [Bacteroidales bacterium]
MRKIVLLLFLSIVCLKIQAQTYKDSIKGDWIPVQSTYGANKIHDHNTYAIFDFNDSLLLIKWLGSKEVVPLSLQFDDDQLLVDDSLKWSVVYFSKDSLKLQFDDSILMTFVPLLRFEVGEINIDINKLIHNSWLVMDTNNYRERIEFTDVKWDSQESNEMKCLTLDEGDDYFWDDLNRWQVFQYKGFWYFDRTFQQHNNFLHQIIESNPDTIRLVVNIGTKQKHLSLVQIPVCDEYDHIKQTLESKSWKATSTSICDSMERKFEMRFGKQFVDTIYKRAERMIKDDLEFRFNPEQLIIGTSNKAVNDCKWRLSNDGRYIIFLDQSRNPEYFEIVELSERKLVLKNVFYFSHLFEMGNFEQNYTLELE